MATTRRRRSASDRSTEEPEGVPTLADDGASVAWTYAPTPSINPPRPRTQAARYDKDQNVMTVQFREGAVYEYYNVSPNEWRNFRRVRSPGRAINRTFDHKPYARRRELES